MFFVFCCWSLYLEVFVGHHVYTPKFDEEIRKMMRVYNVFPSKYGYLLGIYVNFLGVVSGFQRGIPEAVPLSGTVQGVGKFFFSFFSVLGHRCRIS